MLKRVVLPTVVIIGKWGIRQYENGLRFESDSNVELATLTLFSFTFTIIYCE